MPRPRISLQLATIFLAVSSSATTGSNRLFSQTATSGSTKADACQVSEPPATNSSPILVPTKVVAGLSTQLTTQENGITPVTPKISAVRVNQPIMPVTGFAPQPAMPQSGSANAVTVPMSDETEQAIEDVRRRLGGSGSRFSDLLSPEDESRMFAEALSHVRQEQQVPAPPLTPHTQPSPQIGIPQPVPAPPHVPAQNSNATPQGPMPRQNASPPFTPGTAGYQAFPQLHWAPGQPAAPNQINRLIPSQNLEKQNRPGNQPVQQRYPRPNPMMHYAPLQETEQAAMRRVARQIDALAEQLENIKRYAEADSLRRSAQQFREAVR